MVHEVLKYNCEQCEYETGYVKSLKELFTTDSNITVIYANIRVLTQVKLRNTNRLFMTV